MYSYFIYVSTIVVFKPNILKQSTCRCSKNMGPRPETLGAPGLWLFRWLRVCTELFGNLINPPLGLWLYWSCLIPYYSEGRESPPSGKGVASSATSAKSNVCLLFSFQKRCMISYFRWVKDVRVVAITDFSGYGFRKAAPPPRCGHTMWLNMGVSRCPWLRCCVEHVVGGVWNHSSPPCVNSSGSCDIQWRLMTAPLSVCRVTLWWMD